MAVAPASNMRSAIMIRWFCLVKCLFYLVFSLILRRCLTPRITPTVAAAAALAPIAAKAIVLLFIIDTQEVKRKIF